MWKRGGKDERWKRSEWAAKRVSGRRAGEETSWTDRQTVTHSVNEHFHIEFKSLSFSISLSIQLSLSLSCSSLSRLDSVDCAPFLDEIDAEQIFLSLLPLLLVSSSFFLSLSSYFFLVSLFCLNLRVNSSLCFLQKDKEGIRAGQTVLANWPGFHNPVLFWFLPGLGSNEQEQKVWNWIHSLSDLEREEREREKELGL